MYGKSNLKLFFLNDFTMGCNQNGKSHRQVKLIFFTIITVKFNVITFSKISVSKTLR